MASAFYNLVQNSSFRGYRQSVLQPQQPLHRGSGIGSDQTAKQDPMRNGRLQEGEVLSEWKGVEVFNRWPMNCAFQVQEMSTAFQWARRF